MTLLGCDSHLFYLVFLSLWSLIVFPSSLPLFITDPVGNRNQDSSSSTANQSSSSQIEDEEEIDQALLAQLEAEELEQDPEEQYRAYLATLNNNQGSRNLESDEMQQDFMDESDDYYDEEFEKQLEELDKEVYRETMIRKSDWRGHENEEGDVEMESME